MSPRAAALAPWRDEVAEQFDDTAQQRHAASLGMWVFLATEMMFFGVVFFGYALARAHFPADFAAASRRTSLVLGTLNTAILLTSSFTMALGVRAAALHSARAAARLLLATAALGILFAAVKLTEYGLDYRGHLVPVLDFTFDPARYAGALLFFWLYFATTGLHLVHLSIGVALVARLAARARRHADARFAAEVEMTGLYWHFVDLVWIFLYPCLYLIARS